MQTLLVTVDSLRADHLGQYGYRRDTMPALDRVAQSGATFERAFANAPYTRISIPSFQTSRYLGYAALDELPTVATVLSNADVQTAVIGTQTAIDIAEFGYDETIDLDEGGLDDETYHQQTLKEHSRSEQARYYLNEAATSVSLSLQKYGLDRIYSLLSKPYNALFGGSGFTYQGYTSAAQVTDAAIEWLRSRGDDSFFLWLHYMDPHRPYGIHDDDPAYLGEQPPERRVRELMKQAGTDPASITEAERRLLVDLYDSDIRYCARHLERLFDALAHLGIWEELNLVFSADHGEEFGEHGRFFHRNYPYDELMHVPLIVKAPSLFDGGEHISTRRQLLDIPPTVCALHGVEPDGSFEGDHLATSDGGPTLALGQPHDTDPAVTVRTDDWKYISGADTNLLYDLEADPGEQVDVSSSAPDMVRQLHNEIPDYLRARDVEHVRSPEDSVDRERLEALGYLELQEGDT
jgi:arylsulfatase A-like enzyme